MKRQTEVDGDADIDYIEMVANGLESKEIQLDYLPDSVKLILDPNADPEARKKAHDQLKIKVLLGVLVILMIIVAFSSGGGSNHHDRASVNDQYLDDGLPHWVEYQKGTINLSDNSYSVRTDGLPWYKRIFCRGSHVSADCFVD